MNESNLPPAQKILNKVKKVKCNCLCHSPAKNEHSRPTLEDANLKKTKLSFTVQALDPDSLIVDFERFLEGIYRPSE